MRTRPSYIYLLLSQVRDLLPLILVALCVSILALINLMSDRPKSKPIVQNQEIIWSALQEFRPQKR